MLRPAAIIVFSLLLSACATGYQNRGTPAPVEERSESAPPEARVPATNRDETTVTPGTAEEGRLSVPPAPAPEPASPVSSLLASADAAIAAGEFEQAAAICERALRISPRDGHVWYRLASIRYQQQRYSEAQGLAQRALSFAGTDRTLVREGKFVMDDSDSYGVEMALQLDRRRVPVLVDLSAAHLMEVARTGDVDFAEWGNLADERS